MDPSGSKITITFDLKGKDYLKAQQNSDNSFTLKVTRSVLEQKSQKSFIKIYL